jgi:hypothetical protein
MVGEKAVYYDWRNPGLTIAGLRVIVEFFSFGFTF